MLIVDVEHSHVRFLGNLVLNLWDCGGYVYRQTLSFVLCTCYTSCLRANVAVVLLYICCSQDAFYENYFESQRDHIFRSVELLIYVFDIESREIDVRAQRFARDELVVH